jgi:hypothetical protein
VAYGGSRQPKAIPQHFLEQSCLLRHFARGAGPAPQFEAKLMKWLEQMTRYRRRSRGQAGAVPDANASPLSVGSPLTTVVMRAMSAERAPTSFDQKHACPADDLRWFL